MSNTRFPHQPPGYTGGFPFGQAPSHLARPIRLRATQPTSFPNSRLGMPSSKLSFATRFPHVTAHKYWKCHQGTQWSVRRETGFRGVRSQTGVWERDPGGTRRSGSKRRWEVRDDAGVRGVGDVRSHRRFSVWRSAVRLRAAQPIQDRLNFEKLQRWS